ncbi:MAG TPA: YvrJ family protein [Bacillales bacterium]|nr:YvrJ family protein [Bacillales bacterium]
MTPAETPFWIALLGNFGFPIAITVYLFLRFEKKLDNLGDVIMQLVEVIKTAKYSK